MQYKITHQTEYVFDSEVFLYPHHLRFCPRQTPCIKLVDFSIAVKSKPIGHKRIRDEESNTVDFYWFEGMTEKLTIKAESILEVKPFNPFDFILYPAQFNEIPFEYFEPQRKLLYSALYKKPISEALLDYGNTILKSSNYQTVTYITDLTKRIQQDFAVVHREVGAPFSPNRTFKHLKGSCRDLAWMQINLFRKQGIAARFVSGYYFYDMEEPNYELHAWVDVFLPGAGWVGVDPSYGMLTCNTHFPIAVSAIPDKTMPVSGGIRGNASSKLITQLSIEKI
ncbi:MAG: transglutaminase family protein [Psychroserpens sp.]|uniref:transglutaminase family protein n=1 Tax=Psychroserpens sp. TaxID=2020870 RepID=UPI003C714A30